MVHTYNELIKEWFNRAEKEKDYFTKFIFIFISFVAFISQRYGDVERDCEKKRDFKLEKDAKDYYLMQIKNDPHLNECVKKLVDYLNADPIVNITRMSDSWNGKLINIYDWPNLVEYWFRVRNNLFHGHKSPELEKDQILVKFAFETLYPLMKNFIEKQLFWDFSNYTHTQRS